MNQKKRAYIIHGWCGHPSEGIKPWLKSKLEENNYLVESRQMPNADFPIVKEWVDFMKEMINDPDKDVTLIGHSLGCPAILHYLESLPEGIVIDKVVMIAGVVNKINNISEEQNNFIMPWLQNNLDVKKIKKSVNKIFAFFSDNDPFIPLETEEIMREKFGAKTFIESKKGHFNEKDGIYEVPSVLAVIIK